MDLPPLFTSPYASDVAPADCCCGGGAQVVINLTPSPVVNPETGQIITRSEQASAIIAKAKATGFPVFAGS